MMGAGLWIVAGIGGPVGIVVGLIVLAAGASFTLLKIATGAVRQMRRLSYELDNLRRGLGLDAGGQNVARLRVTREKKREQPGSPDSAMKR
jgi:hypothetical protein